MMIVSKLSLVSFSVMIQLRYTEYIKQSLSYAINFPDTTPRYRIYVRLAKDSIPSDSTLIDLANKVAALKELKS